jgi:GNAT superfamily N-acetyltransferase
VSFELRRLNAADEVLLREYLYLALFVPEGEPPFPPGIVERPDIARYVAGWGRTGDRGLLAVESSAGRDVGAAWLRLWPAGEAGYGYVDQATPELSMAVRPEFRGQGLGTLLLHRLLADADDRHAAVSLSVSSVNPAIRLYRRFGFVVVAATEGSKTMRRERGSRVPM